MGRGGHHIREDLLLDVLLAAVERGGVGIGGEGVVEDGEEVEPAVGERAADGSGHEGAQDDGALGFFEFGLGEGFGDGAGVVVVHV